MPDLPNLGKQGEAQGKQGEAQNEAACKMRQLYCVYTADQPGPAYGALLGSIQR